MVSRYKKKDPQHAREQENYENPIASRELILEYLEHIGRPASRQHLEKALDIHTDDQREALRRRLRAMERDAQIMSNRRGSYALVNRLDLISGRVEGHKDGFGLFFPDDGGDRIYLNYWEMRRAFHGDRVLVRLTGDFIKKMPEGVVAEIIEHTTKTVIGRLCVDEGVVFVSPDNPKIQQDISIASDKTLNAKPGEIVVAKILTYPLRRRQATGEVIEVLGQPMAPGIEIDVAIRSHELPLEWNPAALAEAQKITEEMTSADLENRKDLTDKPFVTIDGVDAKDFDDAVFAHQKKTGGWTLMVAIADVTHYLKPGSELDNSAYARGNSVYFPGRVIPMLPEHLSNGVCSLKPDVKRLVFVCEMQVSKDGRLTRFKFYKAVIQSCARLTYSQVANMLADHSELDAPFADSLQALYALYQVLHSRRQMRGALDFDTTETRIVFDQTQKIKKIVPVVRNDAHRLIEECMLLANVAAAKQLQRHNMATLFRVHEKPDQTKLAELREFLQGFGLKLKGGKDPKPIHFSEILTQIRGRKEEKLLQTVLLRSLSQAVYSAELGEHFGLAYEAYVHFTSPIRRYPDVLVHRALAHIDSGGELLSFPYDDVYMKAAGLHCSMTERRADEASRDVTDWLKCEYMVDKVGQTFSGIITTVTGFGIFVRLDDIYVEGLVHITALKNDYYTFDRLRHQLIGRSGNNRYRVGDLISITVARVDLEQRYIDFVLPA